MDFKNVSGRFKSKANAQSDGVQPKQHDFAESYRIRARMIGVLIHDARLNAERSVGRTPAGTRYDAKRTFDFPRTARYYARR